jgi:hypothetical protein
MSDTNQKREDEVLRRMLNTKPKLHKDEKSKSALGRTRKGG